MKYSIIKQKLNKVNDIQLINGSWTQTLTSILHEINEKLNDTEIDDIIRRIDENFENDIISLKIDNTFIKYNIMSILNKLNDIDTLKVNDIYIREEINNVLNRLNSISVVKEVTLPTLVKSPKKCRVPVHRQNDRPTHKPTMTKECSRIYIMDMDLRQGYGEQYRIDISPGVYTHDWRLSWLIHGDKRRLMYKGELTEDILKIYKNLGIVDVDVIKKSRIS